MSNSDDLLRNGIDDFINAALKEEASEIRDGINDNSGDDSSGVQQSTLALNANTQALKANNEEKQKTLTIDQAINNAIQESLKQRNEMIAYHGSGATFSKFDRRFLNTGAGNGELFGNGVYTGSNPRVGEIYAKDISNNNEAANIYDKLLKESNSGNVLKEIEDEVVRLKGVLKELDDEYKKQHIIYSKYSFKDLENLKNSPNIKDIYREKDIAFSEMQQINHYKKMYENKLHSYDMFYEDLKNNDNDIGKAMSAYRKNVYTLAIPKDTGNNYFDWDKKYNLEDIINTDSIKEIKEYQQLLENIKKEIGSNISGSKLFYSIRDSYGSDETGISVASQIIKKLGYEGIKYPSLEDNTDPGLRKTDKNYVVFDEDKVSVLKIEDLLAGEKESFFERNSINNSFYDSVIYIENSLKELADKFTSTTNTIEGKGITLNSNGDSYNVPATKVNDLILRRDGTAYITDSLDEMIISKNFDKMNLGAQNVRYENSKQIIEGTIKENDAKLLAKLTDSFNNIEKLEKYLPVLMQSSKLPNGSVEKKGSYSAIVEDIVYDYVQNEVAERFKDAKADGLTDAEINSISDDLNDIYLQYFEELNKQAQEALINSKSGNQFVKSLLMDPGRLYDMNPLANNEARSWYKDMRESAFALRPTGNAWHDSLNAQDAALRDSANRQSAGLQSKEQAVQTIKELMPLVNEITANIDKIDTTGDIFEKLNLMQNAVKELGNILELTKDIDSTDDFEFLSNITSLYTNLSDRLKNFGSLNSESSLDESAFRNESQAMFDDRRYRQEMEALANATSERYDQMLEDIEDDRIEANNSHVLDELFELREGELSDEQALWQAEQAYKEAVDKNAEALLESLEANEDMTNAEKERAKALEEQNRYERTHSVYKARWWTSEGKPIKGNLKEREDKWLEARALKYNFDRYKSQIDNRFKEDIYENGFRVGSRNKATNTRLEDDLVNQTDAFAMSLENLYKTASDKYKVIKELEDKLYKGSLTEKEQSETLEELNKNTEEYNSSMDKLIKAYEQANKETVTDYADSIRKYVANGGNVAGQRMRDAKYAWRRDREQTATLQAEGYLTNYNTSGYFKDSWNKTLFNRATGFRQQRGLTGFAANLGYNTSGVGLSLGLGAAATALKKFGDVVGNFTKQSIEAYGQLETVRTNLGIVYGSQSEANTAFNEIAQYATKSPFGVETVSQFAVQLKQSGVYASNLMDTLKQIGDVAGGNQQKFGNIANAFSQIEANGKATTRQLREFATAGIPIYAQLSKQLGKNVEQIRQMTAQGQISASIIEEAFSQLTGEGGMFHNAVNIGAKTWAARRQNLADAKQLAQAQYGQWLINLGGTSSTDNNSYAKNILNFLEKFYSGVENLFLLQNISKDVSAIESRDNSEKELERLLEYANESGNKELANIFADQLSDTIARRNYSQERASNAQVVSIYVDKDEEYKQNQILLDQYKKQLENIEKRQELLKGIGKEESEENLKLSDQYAYINGLVETLEKSQSKLNRTILKTQDYYNDESKVLDYYISKAEAYGQKGFDLLSTYATKGSGVLSEVGTPNSLYKMYQDSIEKAKQTPAGKLRIEQQQEREWEEMRKKYDELSPYLDKTATLTEDNVISLEKLSEILKSGIINPLEKFDLTPERMSNNKNKAKSVGRTVEQNEADWKEFSKKIDSLRNIDLRGFSDRDIENLQNVFAKMFGGEASDFTYKINKDGSKTFNDVSNFEEEVKNTEKNVKAFNNVFALFIKSLEKDNEEIAKVVEAYLSSKGEIAEKPEDFKTLNPKVDPYPLWQRIISQTLGVDLNLFKNTGSGKGWATNGSQALQLYQKQMEKQTIKSVLSATMSSMGLGRALGLTSGNYLGREPYISNNSKDGTRQIDWNGMYKSTKDFALSLESSAEVTRAYADSLTQSQSALEDFLSSSITQMEDPANIYDENYKKVLGEYAENIKAVDANAFDMLFKDLGNGVYMMRENAIEAAKSLYELNQITVKTASTTAEMKDKMKAINLEIGNSSLYNELLVRSGNVTNLLINGLSREDSNSVIKELISEVVKRTQDETDVLYGKDAMALVESYIKSRSFDKDNTIVDRSRAVSLSEQIASSNKQIEQYTNLYKDISSLRAQISELNIKVQAPGYKQYVSNSTQNEENAKLGEMNNALKQWERLIDFIDDTTSKMEALNGSYNTAEEKINALNTSYESLTVLLNGSIDKAKANERTDALTKFFTISGPRDSYYSPYLNGERNYQNSYRDQMYLNMAGVSSDKLWSDFRNSLLIDKDGNYDLNLLKRLSENGLLKGNEQKQYLMKMLTSGAIRNDEQILAMSDGEESLARFKSLIDELIKAEIALGDSTKRIEDAFSDLAKTSKDALFNGIGNGLSKTFQQAGSNARLMADNVIDGKEAAEKYPKIWRDVGVEMLNTIGAAATHTGLTLIAEGAKKGKEGYGMMAAGAGLLAAGGVLQIAGGFLSSDNDKEVDKNKQEEERLKSLRDLLKEIIDQAKTDAQYYETHMRHQNAISVQSVNDAIITPQGNVVSTHPDDYLIATKTPGSLVNAGQTKVEPKVTLTVVNASGTQMNAEETSRKIDKDGNLDIELTLTAAIGTKIANGEMDSFFDARDSRLRGRSYVG